MSQHRDASLPRSGPGAADGPGEPAPLRPTRVSIYPDLRRAILLAAGVYLVFRLAGSLADLLLFFLLIFIVAAALNPVVTWLEQRRVPRGLAATGVVLAVLGILVGSAFLVVPTLVSDLGGASTQFRTGQGQFASQYAEFLRRSPQFAPWLPPPERLLRQAVPNLAVLVGRLAGYAFNVVSGVGFFVLLWVLVALSLAHPEPLLGGLLSAVPRRHRECAETALRRILEQLQNWALGSLTLGAIIGVATALGLWLLGKITGHQIPYILMFSLLAGLGELVPNIGPIVSALPPILVAVIIDPMLAVWVAVLFLVIQQLENNLIVPLVMSRSLSLHPVSVVVTILIMGMLFGLLDAVIAVPVCAMLKVLWEELYLKPAGIDERRTLEAARRVIGREAADVGRGTAASGEQLPSLSRPRRLRIHRRHWRGSY